MKNRNVIVDGDGLIQVTWSATPEHDEGRPTALLTNRCGKDVDISADDAERLAAALLEAAADLRAREKGGAP